jgi:hypothetical protein
MRVLFLSIERHSGNVEPTMPLMLASPAIPPSGEIPSQYTCDGQRLASIAYTNDIKKSGVD